MTSFGFCLPILCWQRATVAPQTANFPSKPFEDTGSPICVAAAATCPDEGGPRATFRAIVIKIRAPYS